MKQFKTHKSKRIRWNFFIGIIIVLLSFFLYISISVQISPKLVNIATIKIDNYYKDLLMKYLTTDDLSEDDLSEDDLKDIIELVRNNKDEIVAVNYNMNITYNILKVISNKLEDGFNNNLSDISKYNITNNNSDIILSYPMGIVSDNVYFNNFGPNVPIKISFLTNLVTGIKTNVNNYGINNVLVSAYLNVDVVSNIVVPLQSQNITEHYEILLASEVVMGNVPTYMGSTIESQSPIVSN